MGGVKTAVVNAGTAGSSNLTTVTVNPNTLPPGTIATSLSQAALASSAISQAASQKPTKYVVVTGANGAIKTEIKEEVESSPQQSMDLT